MDDAIDRTARIVQRMRDQAGARYACPWRFEAYPLAELAEAPADAELEAWMEDLDLRLQRAIEGDEEDR